MGDTIKDLRNEELSGEMIYIFEDGAERSIGKSRSNSMNEERNEENITEGDEEVGNKENFDRNKEDYNQGNACVNDDIVHGHGCEREKFKYSGKTLI